MEHDQANSIRVHGGYCRGCQSFYVAIEMPDTPQASKHGFTYEKAHEVWLTICKLLEAARRPGAPMKDLIEAALIMLDVIPRPKPAEPVSMFGKPRFG
jgi:hypothetical protein